ncbi:MAG: hypothetical protein KKH28_12195 [Elusimicrobia bacterium]|nr:hypothetical protein [Elusimicrobiota bacterium]
MNFQNILSRKEIRYVEGAFAIVRFKWIFFVGILVIGLSWLFAVRIVAASGLYAYDQYAFGFFKVISFKARLFDVNLFKLCAYLCALLCFIFVVASSMGFALVVNRLRITGEGNIALHDRDYGFLQGLSLWLDKKSPRLWTSIIILLSLAEISRELYVDWGFSAAGLAFIFLLSPVLILPFAGIIYSRDIRIIEKILGAPVQPGAGWK